MKPTGTEPEKKKRRSGIPTGTAGEYFVMGELQNLDSVDSNQLNFFGGPFNSEVQRADFWR